MVDFEGERAKLVDSLKLRGYITSKFVEEALRRVPREEFLPHELREEAYIDTPLPIGEGQTISAPHMVAIMIDNLDLAPGQKVLEVGTGSGYHAAVCSEAVSPGGHVFTVERVTSLAAFAEENLKKTGYRDSVTVVVGDGSKGWPKCAPFDRIFVAAAAPEIPPPLTDQLTDGGRLLIPVGGRWYQELTRVTRHDRRLEKEDLGGCVFVPLIGEYGFRSD